jgi:hypothetical protein
MNHSLHSADRSTHLKVVVVALVAAIAVIAVGISARMDDSSSVVARTQGPVLKAGQPATYTRSETSAVR